MNIHSASAGGAAEVRGVGLFTGAPSVVRLTRTPHGDGLVFVRTDVPGSPRIPALARHVFADPRLPGRNTSLIADPGAAPGATNPTVATVEHVLSALAGVGEWDVRIEVDGPEVPIGDGSALPFVEAMRGAGWFEGPAPEPGRPVRCAQWVEVRDERAPHGNPAPVVRVEPRAGGGPEFSYLLDYAMPGALARSAASVVLERERYIREVAPARTFCLKREAEAMRAAGLFRHVTTREMLVFDEAGRPIDNELRFADEPARHKLLDLIGDLALVGGPLEARVSAERSGHALNHEAARAVVEETKRRRDGEAE